jgi:putative ABC transport system permease protein
MNIFRAYKRTRLFLWVNITGLAIGLATSGMLILFVTNELTYDKSIPGSERIISLNTVMEDNGTERCLPITTRKAMTELPANVPGIEAVTQVYNNIRQIDIKYNDEVYMNIPATMTEPGFCDVFSIELTEGNKTDLDKPDAVFISDKYADIIFGNASEAMYKTIKVGDDEYTVYGVMKSRKGNTHFHFDMLLSFPDYIKEFSSIEFFTFYKIEKGVNIDKVRTAIEKEYTNMVTEFLKSFSGKAFGITEKLTDIYLNTKAYSTLGKKSSMDFVRLLFAIAIFILLLAITNFVNLFIAQGELRMMEIGIRKSNGASVKDIAIRFIYEIGSVILLSFFLSVMIIIIVTPYFSELINREIDLLQLVNPATILSAVLILLLTLVLSASYPIFYLSRFNTLDILSKRISFSRRRLTAVIVIFQSVVSIVLIACILIIGKQTSYLREQPLGYNPKNVTVLFLNDNMTKEYNSLRNELLKKTGIKNVSTADHIFGRGPSGQGISLLGSDSHQSINEYRINWEITEILEIELEEGSFYKEDDPANANTIILNKAAIDMLGLSYPVTGTTVNYKGNKEIRGVVKDFYFDKIENRIQPMILTFQPISRSLYIKFDEKVSHKQAIEMTSDIIKSIDPGFYISSPIWLEDIYNRKFNSLETQSRLLMIASFLSVFISMIGLLAIHSFSVMRRTKEISLRRINGASTSSIFNILTVNIVKWIIIAGILAMPLFYFIIREWLVNYPDHVSIDTFIIIMPVFLQIIIAITVTSGITLRTALQNPVKFLKSE